MGNIHDEEGRALDHIIEELRDTDEEYMKLVNHIKEDKINNRNAPPFTHNSSRHYATILESIVGPQFKAAEFQNFLE